MKVSEFRKLIREEVRKVLKENDNPESLQSYIERQSSGNLKNALQNTIPQMLNTPAQNIIVVPRFKGGAKRTGNETEKAKKLYDFYEQPSYKDSFSGTNDLVGGMYFSKKGKAVYWDSEGQDYYILSKSMFNNIQAKQI